MKRRTKKRENVFCVSGKTAGRWCAVGECGCGLIRGHARSRTLRMRGGLPPPRMRSVASSDAIAAQLPGPLAAESTKDHHQLLVVPSSLACSVVALSGFGSKALKPLLRGRTTRRPRRTAQGGRVQLMKATLARTRRRQRDDLHAARRARPVDACTARASRAAAARPAGRAPRAITTTRLRAPHPSIQPAEWRRTKPLISRASTTGGQRLAALPPWRTRRFPPAHRRARETSSGARASDASFCAAGVQGMRVQSERRGSGRARDEIA